MSRLDVKGPPASKMLNEQAKTNIKRAGLRLDDDQTHVSSSSTKAPSLDGKSTTSGTTFALDEKESLRPDDSASAKAVDDEDCGSGPASNAPNSRVGSEAGGRAFRDQFYEITESIGHRPHPLSQRVIEGIEEEGPQTSIAPIVTPMPAPMPMVRPDAAVPMQPSMDLLYREPDEKLFEALESPKDRMFLLRLEQDIINFIKGSSEPKIDLPPCNSFCRLLAHKLADYYALTHFVDNAVSSVTLYRTPYCRIPTPLGELAKAQAANTSSAPVVLPAMKIMRRPGKDGNVDSGAGTNESSVVPSKAGSENGEESQQGTGVISPTESNLAKDKSSLTREEREARYKEKREELFGPQSENTDDSPESTKEVSRTSSRNEKKKKNKQKKDDDDFEARSQFNAYYPTLPYPANPYDQAAAGAFFNPYGMQPSNASSQQGIAGAAMMQQGYQHGFQAMSNAQGYPNGLGQNAVMNSYNGQPAPQNYGQQNPSNFNQQTPTQYFAQLHQGMGMGQHSPAISSPSMSHSAQVSRPQSQMSDQQWTQNGYANGYQQSQQQQQFYPPPNPPAYPYGQLPYQPGFQNKAVHPLPGSYNRSAFNPATRAFVPGSGSMAPQPSSGYGSMSPQPPNYAASPNTSMMRPQPISYPNGQPGPPYPSYNPHAPSYPQVPSYPQMLGSYNPSQPEQPRSNRKTPGNSQSAPNSNNSPNVQQSSLSKWGTPAHLPPKPPPVDTPSLPEAQHSLPMNNQFGVNVQAVNGGQPMPNFSNGVYSMPGVGS